MHDLKETLAFLVVSVGLKDLGDAQDGVYGGAHVVGDSGSDHFEEVVFEFQFLNIEKVSHPIK